ncbi:zinc finger protein 28-like [Ostrinia furnacalis]|uniref:zinc finger protein 28-like n=1 Tax=Ostrinia furnacalis TaxID=93504 RepID=UPI00103C64B0|nr:zinc finger protein 28-like [Ostrinia furnacalis]
MAYDCHHMSTALKFLSGQSEEICRLCLASTAGQTVANIGDSFVLQRPYYEGSVTFVEMLHELGVGADEALPGNFCNVCADTVANAYLFKRLLNYSSSKWAEVMSRLSSSLNLAESARPNGKSVYLIINECGNDMFTSRNSPIVKKDVLIQIRKSYSKAKKKYSTSVKCTECDKKFKSYSQLSKHNVKVHNKTKNTCPHCFKIFATPGQLEYHAERVHYPKKIKCPKCKKMFSTHRMLKYHDRAKHVAVICKLCGVQVPCKQKLQAHLEKHKANKCPRCGKNFANIYTYRAHAKVCGKEGNTPNFFCDICNKGYVSKNSIRSHIKTDHGFGEVLKCKVCEKKFDAVSKLKNHMVKHTKERNFHCDQCGNRFVTQAALVYHVRLHTGEKPFPCELCNESFLSASRRMDHKHRKHFGPTKQCSICPMKFVTSSQLRIHMNRHSNPHSKLYSGADLQPITVETFIPQYTIVNLQ